MNTEQQSTIAIQPLLLQQIQDIFGRTVSGLWYILFSTFFFFFMVLVYRPFNMEQVLDMGRGQFFLNATLCTCIVAGCLLFLRLLFLLINRLASVIWINYIFWCLFEMLFVAFFLALFIYLKSGQSNYYFYYVGLSLKYSFLILFYPYFSVTSMLCIVDFLEKQRRISQKADLIRFTDSAGNVRIVLSASVILYIKAEVNYVRIYYLDGSTVKEYQLHNTMNALRESVEKFGLFRCQRSYYVNVSHVSSLRKDPNDVINVELDCGDIRVPVSRNLYMELASRL